MASSILLPFSGSLPSCVIVTVQRSCRSLSSVPESVWGNLRFPVAFSWNSSAGCLHGDAGPSAMCSLRSSSVSHCTVTYFCFFKQNAHHAPKFKLCSDRENSSRVCQTERVSIRPRYVGDLGVPQLQAYGWLGCLPLSLLCDFSECSTADFLPSDDCWTNWVHKTCEDFTAALFWISKHMLILLL